MIIYKITNTINNKIYIGCTTKTVEERFYRHWVRRFSSTALGRALKKYDKKSFTYEIIEECVDIKQMYSREIFWIKKYNSNNPKIGYNLTDGGDAGPIRKGKKHWNFGGKNERLSLRDKELKGKTFEEIYGVDKSIEIKKKLSLKSSGRKHNKKSIKKMSDKRKFAWLSGKYKDNGVTISKIKTGTRSNKRIKIICLNNNVTYDGYTQAAELLGLSVGNITNVVNNKYKHTKGFKFKKVG